MKSCQAKGTYHFNHKFASKAPVTSRFRQAQAQQLREPSLSYITNQVEILTDILIKRPTVQAFAKCQFKLTNLTAIYQNNPTWGPTNLHKVENISNHLQELPI